MEIAMEGNQDRSRSYAGSGRTQDDEDEDGGVVDCGEVVTGYRRPGWMVGPSGGPAKWARHHRRDLHVMK